MKIYFVCIRSAKIDAKSAVVAMNASIGVCVLSVYHAAVVTPFVSIVAFARSAPIAAASVPCVNITCSSLFVPSVPRYVGFEYGRGVGVPVRVVLEYLGERWVRVPGRGGLEYLGELG